MNLTFLFLESDLFSFKLPGSALLVPKKKKEKKMGYISLGGKKVNIFPNAKFLTGQKQALVLIK